MAFVVAYSAVRVRYGKKHAEILSDAFFYLIIVWKLSVLITDFSSVIRSPLSLIYFDGGVVGFYFGLAFIAGKVLLDRKKGRLAADGFRALFTGAVVVQAVYQVMMVLLNEGELVAQVVTVVVFALFVLFYWMKVAMESSSIYRVVHGGSCLCCCIATGRACWDTVYFDFTDWMFFVVVLGS